MISNEVKTKFSVFFLSWDGKYCVTLTNTLLLLLNRSRPWHCVFLNMYFPFLFILTFLTFNYIIFTFIIAWWLFECVSFKYILNYNRFGEFILDQSATSAWTQLHVTLELFLVLFVPGMRLQDRNVWKIIIRVVVHPNELSDGPCIFTGGRPERTTLLASWIGFWQMSNVLMLRCTLIAARLYDMIFIADTLKLIQFEFIHDVFNLIVIFLQWNLIH